MTVNACIYSFESSFSLSEVGAQNGIAESDKIRYAASIFSGLAPSWWFLIVQGSHVPASWNALASVLRSEVEPFDLGSSCRDRFIVLRQLKAFEDYITKCRNIILTIPEMSECE